MLSSVSKHTPPQAKGAPALGTTKDVAGALVRIADALDRAVWVLENLAVSMEIVHPDDVGPSPVARRAAGLDEEEQ